MFPAETFIPKVQMEQDVAPKHCPRNVEMERRRRLYKHIKIQDTLASINIIPKEMLPPSALVSLLSYDEKYGLFSIAHFLPLEIFDDEDYDCRYVKCCNIEHCLNYLLNKTKFYQTYNLRFLSILEIINN